MIDQSAGGGGAAAGTPPLASIPRAGEVACATIGCGAAGTKITTDLPAAREELARMLFTACQNDTCLEGRMANGWSFSAPESDAESQITGIVQVSVVSEMHHNRTEQYLQTSWSPRHMADGDRYRMTMTLPDGRRLRLYDTKVTYFFAGRTCGGDCIAAVADLVGLPPIDTLAPPEDDAGIDDAGL